MFHFYCRNELQFQDLTCYSPSGLYLLDREHMLVRLLPIAKIKNIFKSYLAVLGLSCGMWDLVP